MGDKVALATLIRFIPASDEVNGYSPSARQMVKSCRHPGQHDGLDEARPMSH
jgi:hypothetical protein